MDSGDSVTDEDLIYYDDENPNLAARKSWETWNRTKMHIT
jgi:hypothetical protein